jgi:hypothetical protein
LLLTFGALAGPETKHVEFYVEVPAWTCGLPVELSRALGKDRGALGWHRIERRRVPTARQAQYVPDVASAERIRIGCAYGAAQECQGCSP